MSNVRNHTCINLELRNDTLTISREQKHYEASRPGVPGPDAFRGQQELSVDESGSSVRWGVKENQETGPLDVHFSDEETKAQRRE